MAEKTPDFATLAIHAGAQPDPTTGARVTPIYQTTSFVFEDVEHAANLFALNQLGNIYTRLTNPTVSALQERLAALEGGIGATATASGHSAQILALLPLMEPGDHIVASKKLYGGSLNQMSNTFRKFGWQTTFVEPDDVENFRKAVTPRTKAFFIEALANPGGVVVDIEAVAKIAHEAGVPLIVDNTLATPYLCRPFEFGADIVTHSTTKFLAGHGNALGGVVIDSGNFDWTAHGDRFPALTQPLPDYHGTVFAEKFGKLAYTFYNIAVGLRDVGPAQSPMNAFLTLTGIETLPLRMRQHSDNALQVARYLEAHPAVSYVSYAGLESSPYYPLAQKYLPNGAGAVFTFGLKGGYDAGVKVVESVKLFSHLANIGDTRSLIIHPASTTHSQLPDEEKAAAGAAPTCCACRWVWNRSTTSSPIWIRPWPKPAEGDRRHLASVRITRRRGIGPRRPFSSRIASATAVAIRGA